MAETPLDQLGLVDGNTFGAADLLKLTDASIQTGPTADRPTGTRRRAFKLFGDTTTNQLLCWDAVNSVWQVLFQPAVAWTAWTPVIGQGVFLTFTNTRSRYSQVGKTVTATLEVSVTSSGTAASPVIFSVPVTAASATGNTPIGVGFIYDQSAPFKFKGEAILLDTARFILQPTDNPADGALGTIDFASAVTTGDTLAAQITYEAA